jgi:hypothetical protein
LAERNWWLVAKASLGMVKTAYVAAIAKVMDEWLCIDLNDNYQFINMNQ